MSLQKRQGGNRERQRLVIYFASFLAAAIQRQLLAWVNSSQPAWAYSLWVAGCRAGYPYQVDSNYYIALVDGDCRTSLAFLLQLCNSSSMD